MSAIDIEDVTGEMRSPQDFAEARRVVQSRIVKGGLPTDIELYMQYTTILEALRIAEIISAHKELKR